MRSADPAAPDATPGADDHADDHAASGQQPGRPRAVLSRLHWRLPAVLAIAGVVVVRTWPRIVHPTLWAEDGTRFFADAWLHPVRALWLPFGGYLQVVPRFLADAGRLLPISWTPGAYAVLAVGTEVLIISLALSDRLRWLLPYRWQRVLTGLLLAAAPAANEVSGNLANLIFFSGIGLLVVALCEDPATRRGRAAELAVTAVLGLTGPLVGILLPAFAARWWRTRSRHSAHIGLVALGCAALQWTLLAIRQRERNGGLDLLPLYGLKRVAGAWVFGENGIYAWWPEHHAAMVVGLLVWVLGLAIAVGALGRPTAIGLALSLLIALGTAVDTYGELMLGPGAGQRHLLLPLAVITIVLVAGLASPALPVRCVAAACLLAGATGVVNDFVLSPRPFHHFGGIADCLRSDRPYCEQAINPGRWRIRIHRTAPPPAQSPAALGPAPAGPERGAVQMAPATSTSPAA